MIKYFLTLFKIPWRYAHFEKTAYMKKEEVNFMNTNFDLSALKDRVKWRRALALFLSMVLLLTGITIPDSPFGGSMTAHASASGDADEDPRGTYYRDSSFPISYLEQEEIHEITAEGNLGTINAITWYQFTPTETAVYTFKGNNTGNNEPDTYGSIYTKNTESGCYEEVASSDDDNGMQFKIVTTLQAGTTYYLCAAYFSINGNGEYIPSFNKTYIEYATTRINDIEKSHATTKAGQSYVLKADVACASGTTPTYEWYTIEGENNARNPLPGTGNTYTYAETGGSEKNIWIYCDVKAGTEVETLRFRLDYYPIRIIGTYVDGTETDYLPYQMNRTYNLSVDAISNANSALTYTWKLGETALQTGNSNTLSYTPKKENLGENYSYFYITCEVSDRNGNKSSSYIEFNYEAITDVKREINGKETNGRVTVLQGVSYTLKISAASESGKPLTYQWERSDNTILGTGQTYQYTAPNKKRETIYCRISDGTEAIYYSFTFTIQQIAKPSLTVNGSSASGNAIPVHAGESYQLKVSTETSPGKTLTYQWGTMVDGEFTALSGKTGDTYACSITKAEDILANLVCRISDSDGNTVQQKCYMKYRPIYNVERSINGMPIDSITTRTGQQYALAVKAMGEPGKTLTYAWYENGNKVSSTDSYLYTAKAENRYITCEISDGTNNYGTEFYMRHFDTTTYDFTIKGVSTNIAYAYVGEKVTLELKDKHNMADDIYWSWDSEDSYGSTRYKHQITVTMGNDTLEGYCEWDNGYTTFTVIPCKSHTYTQGTNAATTTADGTITNVCSKCGHTRTETIAKISNIKLSKTDLSYTGKNQNVALTVSDSAGRQLKAGTDYDYTFNGKTNGTISAKNVGRYTVKVTFKGNYSGSTELTFTISPQKVTLSKVSAIKKGFKAVWKKSKAKVTGYEISYSTDKSFKKKTTKTVPVKGYKTTSKTVKKLKAKKTYYVKIRAYQNIKAGKKTVKLYGKWSSAKKVKTRK